ncbi:MAG: tRNA uridine-5-carboxymethylaminomethyl(34) synthesis GTPase MnmE [Butyricicoccus pullicaecorum]|nr:tRNA uridine-5-carboxymethylaminomethyl(34) synthesis GTPase MnmE [Butyricicoccus pullicaecorum]MDO4668290.1 tRNA uridine-5-carboxymethylaminomethyl(34) synthesis GTPase MnmE [Butyricicoccus pullicaecorum]
MAQTIAALSTASGGAIGIVRISGERAEAYLSALFTPIGNRVLEPRMLTYGTLTINGQVIDRPMAVFFPAPATYTGEPMAEIHCHGSSAVLEGILRALFAMGARQAQAGEFTRRAFLNGKLDLFAAEAVNDLVCAQSVQAAALATAQLGGHISSEFSDMRHRLIAMCAQFLAVIDYPDEEIEDLPLSEIHDALEQMRKRLQMLCDSYQRGRALREGLPCAIIGRPNAGKSTLLNALLGYDRAIVTNIAGTTRDTVEETLRLEGLVLRLQDTAGLRETDDPVERIGVGRAKDAVTIAKEDGVVLAVFDGSQPLGAEDAIVIEQAKDAKRAIAVVNKVDLSTQMDITALSQRFSAVVTISAKQHEGLDTLTETLINLTGIHDLPQDGGLITNVRQADILSRTARNLEQASRQLLAGFAPDAIVYEMEQAIDSLGDMTGEHVQEDIIDHIFANFCVGK